MSSRIAPSSPKTASPVAKPTTQTSVASQSQSPSNPGLPRDKVAARAYEKWCHRGRSHGSDHRDWIDAERELAAELAKAKR